MNNVVLSITKKSWASNINHDTISERNPKILEVVKKILKRDDYVCYFCDFRSEEFQELHHIDDDPSNYEEKNLVTACPFCHQCYHLNLVGNSDSGRLIWMPELTQQQLNHLCRSIFVIMHYEAIKDDGIVVDDSIIGAARHLTISLENRVMSLERNLDVDGCSNPTVLAQVLINMSEKDYQNRSSFLKNVRLLPYKSRFTKAIDYYADNIYKDTLRVDNWVNLIKDYNENKK